MDTIDAAWQLAGQHLEEVLSQARGPNYELAGWLGGTDPVAAYEQERDRLTAQYRAAAGNDPQRKALAGQLANLADSAANTILGKPGWGSVPMGQAPPSAGNTVTGNLYDSAGEVAQQAGQVAKDAAEQLGKTVQAVGEGLAFGGVGLLGIVLVAGGLYLAIRWSR